MKFGKTLLKSHIPEWSRSYISYKSLKKLLKNAVASQQQGTEPSEDSITGKLRILLWCGPFFRSHVEKPGMCCLFFVPLSSLLFRPRPRAREGQQFLSLQARRDRAAISHSCRQVPADTSCIYNARGPFADDFAVG